MLHRRDLPIFEVVILEVHEDFQEWGRKIGVDLLKVEFDAKFHLTFLNLQCSDLSFECKIYILTEALYCQCLVAIKIHSKLVRNHIDVIWILGGPYELENQLFCKRSVQNLRIWLAAQRKKGSKFWAAVSSYYLKAFFYLDF